MLGKCKKSTIKNHGGFFVFFVFFVSVSRGNFPFCSNCNQSKKTAAKEKKKKLSFNFVLLSPPSHFSEKSNKIKTKTRKKKIFSSSFFLYYCFSLVLKFEKLVFF